MPKCETPARHTALREFQTNQPKKSLVSAATSVRAAAGYGTSAGRGFRPVH